MEPDEPKVQNKTADQKRNPEEKPVRQFAVQKDLSRLLDQNRQRIQLQRPAEAFRDRLQRIKDRRHEKENLQNDTDQILGVPDINPE